MQSVQMKVPYHQRVKKIASMICQKQFSLWKLRWIHEARTLFNFDHPAKQR
jgi:hypothetical protein